MGDTSTNVVRAAEPSADGDIPAVLRRLDEVIAWARDNESPAGYFAALYRVVTARVASGIDEGLFDDGARMQRLDVVFASRYLDAFDAFRAGRPTTRSWQVAFDQTRRFRPIVLQHLLGGMNAHINLDLGIATATVAPGPELEPLRADFNRINDILASLLQRTKDALTRVWPPLKLLDWLAGSAEDTFVNFSMGLAREGAFRFAQELSVLPPGAWAARIEQRDAVIGGRVARLVYRPGLLLGTAAYAVRLAERGSIDRKIDALGQA